MYMQDMETWDSTDSYYHHEDFETEVYAGASHVRYQYPVTQMGNRTSLTGLLGDHRQRPSHQQQHVEHKVGQPR